MKIVVKLGGATLEDAALLQRAVLAVKQLAAEHQVAVVHGGGAALTRMLAQMGKQSQFVDGLRVTDAETRDFAVMVLAGHMNKKLVAALGVERLYDVVFGRGDDHRARSRAPYERLGIEMPVDARRKTAVEAERPRLVPGEPGHDVVPAARGVVVIGEDAAVLGHGA